jgi:predicted tellurium resistance membrane protein TerC
LCRHAAATTAATAAATETAAAAAAEAIAAAEAAATTAAAAEAITAAAEAIATAKAAAITAAEAAAITKTATEATTALIWKAAETLVPETVPLVLAAPAATSIKTHALLVTFASPNRKLDNHAGRRDMRNPPHTHGLRISITTIPISANDFESYSRGQRHFICNCASNGGQTGVLNGQALEIQGEREPCGPICATAEMIAIFSDPATWAALFALMVMEVVLGIDNLIFISILSNKLPPEQQSKARRLGIGLALGLRLLLLSGIAWLVGLTAPVFDLGISGAPGAHGEPTFETAFSWRDIILIAGGLFLVWKATKEIHHNIDAEPSGDLLDKKGHAAIGFGAVIVQILLLDMVFSIDSILTAVGMTDHLPVMVIAVLVAVGTMMLAADPLARFIARNPTVVMLALGFLLMIGAVLIADGFGVHVPKGYIYAAMAFSAFVEMLNIFGRRGRQRGKGDDGETLH